MPDPSAPDPGPAPKLDEATARRPDFAGGVPLLMPDGRTWWLYQPPAVVEANVGGVGPVLDVRRDFGPGGAEMAGAYDEFLARFVEARKSGDRWGEWNATFSMAALLLVRNYAITFDQAGEIMALDERDAEGMLRFAIAVMEAAIGGPCAAFNRAAKSVPYRGVGEYLGLDTSNN